MSAVVAVAVVVAVVAFEFLLVFFVGSFSFTGECKSPSMLMSDVVLFVFIYFVLLFEWGESEREQVIDDASCVPSAPWC